MTEADLERLSPEAQKRLRWREQAIHWLDNAVPLDSEWKATLLDMFGLWTDAAFNEGIDDAADLVGRIKQAHPTRELQVTEAALRDLAKRNRTPL